MVKGMNIEGVGINKEKQGFNWYGKLHNTNYTQLHNET